MRVTVNLIIQMDGGLRGCAMGNFVLENMKNLVYKKYLFCWNRVFLYYVQATAIMCTQQDNLL